MSIVEVAFISLLGDRYRLGCIFGLLFLRPGVKQQLIKLENRLSDNEVAQFRWWTWASKYRRRKVHSSASYTCAFIV